MAMAKAVCVAAFVAIRYVAHYGLGFSRAEISGGATIVAILIIAIVGIDFFGKKLNHADLY